MVRAGPFLNNRFSLFSFSSLILGNRDNRYNRDNRDIKDNRDNIR